MEVVSKEERRGYGKLKCQGRIILKLYKVILKVVMNTDPLRRYFLYLIINILSRVQEVYKEPASELRFICK